MSTFVTVEHGDGNTTLNGVVIVEVPATQARNSTPRRHATHPQSTSLPVSFPEAELIYYTTQDGTRNLVVNGSVLSDRSISPAGQRVVLPLSQRRESSNILIQNLFRKPSMFVTVQTGNKNKTWNGCYDDTSISLRPSTIRFFFIAKDEGQRNNVFNGVNLNRLQSHDVEVIASTNRRVWTKTCTRDGQTFVWKNLGTGGRMFGARGRSSTI